MKDILMTSSVLILALLILRRGFQKTISRRAQYALWGLVALRLLVPASLPAADFSLLTAAQPVQATVSSRLENREVYLLPVERSPAADYPRAEEARPGGTVPTAESFGYPVLSQDGQTVTKYADKLTAAQLLRLIWYAGICVMALRFLWCNLRFWRNLCKGRTPYSIDDCKYPVYLVEHGLPSPCLFGLVRPAIYLTPAAVVSPERVRHVIAHESTHAWHLDPVWSLVRCACLCVYWFDPLVWAAALASRIDCELACDEGALRQLGETERIPYGQTLLSLIPVRRGASPLLSATTMTADKKQLKDRLTRIAENRQTRAAALFAVLAFAEVVCAVTFTGAKTDRTDDAQPLTGEEQAYFNSAFFTGEDVHLRAQFLTSLYDRPEDIDLYQLLYNGIGEEINDEDLTALKAHGCSLEVDEEKLSTAGIDAFLQQNTGTSLAESNKRGLDQFLYLEEQDAYYHLHGDTNAPTDIFFSYGEREGNLIKLYYDASGQFLEGDFAQGWACLTLEEYPGEPLDGFAYHIVSHRMVPPALQSMTGDELAYFNEEFFNGDDFNIRNQFLTSLYEKPEYIDLFELFYCGTGVPDIFSTSAPSNEELRQLGVLDEQGEQICPTDKFSAEAMDVVLLANTGLTLDETAKIGLDNFARLSQSGAYYHTHGDTNYFHSVQITAGEHVGSTVRLYYPDSGTRYPGCDWLCVTLAEQADGSYWFVSNQPCEKPAIPTVHPDWAPALTIPLGDLKPCEPETVTVTRHTDDCAERGGGYMTDNNISVRAYRSTDGNTYAAVVYDEAVGRDGMLTWDVGCFLTLKPNFSSSADGGISMDFFQDLFGCDGLVISYDGPIPGQKMHDAIHDYYTFADDGTPALLARTYGETAILDLDGDGTNELAAASGETAQLFFQRDGKLYQADIAALVTDAWPETSGLWFQGWDIHSRCLNVSGNVGQHVDGVAERYLFFNGDCLLLYKDERTAVDHVLEGIEAPDDVLAAAKAQGETEYAYRQAHTGVTGGDGQELGTPAEYDDWRLTSLSGPYALSLGGLELEIYGVGYQFHTTTPERVVTAGGAYMTEDQWLVGYQDCRWLIFRTETDGSRTYLTFSGTNDCGPGSELFLSDTAYLLNRNGFLLLSDLEGRDLLAMFSSQPTAFLNRLAEEQTETEQQAVADRLGTYLSENSSVYDVQQTYDACVRYLETFGGDLSDQGRALWEQIRSVASIPTKAGREFQRFLSAVTSRDTVTMTLDTAGGKGGGTYTAGLTDYWRYRVDGWPSDFDWTASAAPTAPLSGVSLTLEAADGSGAIRCWQDSDLVQCTLYDKTVWFRAGAQNADVIWDGRLFSDLRSWYDEAEWRGLTSDIVIPDRGQSHLEVAQAWAEQTANTALKVASGSAFACTYVRVIADVDSWSDIRESAYPEWTEGKERFYFSYTRIFVPETEHAMHSQMAGSTVEYDGSHGPAPDGACMNFQVGPMYLADDGWRCEGSGTGP